ncbi:MAG: trimeric autotransporter adhesin, partial [Frankiales bacterium]|nr:trimeric autotransporter adhesin [Frankiales bacterium]
TDSVDPNTSPEHWHLYKGSSATSLSPLATVDSPNYQDTDVSQSVRYYQLQAETVAGLGPMSQVFMVDTRLTPPTAVTTSSLARRVGFTWAAPTATTPLQLTGYAVYTGSTATALTRSVTTNTVATVRNLAPGAKVYFKVAALYGSTEGPASAVTSVTAGSAQVVAVSQLDQLIALPAGGGTGIPFSTPGLQYVMTPSVSRDGRWITFSAAVCDSCPNQIFVLAYDGASAPRQVTHNQDEEADPTFSADGKTIAFDASPDMYSIPHLATVATAGGTAVTRPGSTGLVDPSYLGSSTTLVATDLTSATAPLRRITTTGAKTSIAGTTNGYQPAVSPDGTKVAYLVSMPDDSDLIRMTVISTGASSSQPMAAVGYIYGPSWSFDAKSFSYSVEPLTSGVSRVWTTLVGTSTHKALSGLDLSLYDPATDSPDYTAPAVKITAPTTTSTTATSVKVAWAATDLQAGVLTSDVRYRKAKGTGALTGYVVPSGWTGTTATYKTLAVAKGYRYCFSVRSKDRDSNISAWTAERCITVK